MNRFLRYRIDHVIFWLATVGFHVYTRWPLLEEVGWLAFVLEIIIRNALLAAMIYTNLGLLIPRLLYRKRVIAYMATVVLVLVGYVVLKNTHDYYLYQSMGSSVAFFSNSFYNLAIAIFYLSFSVALHLSREWYAQRELIRKIEIEKLNTELEYLKAQINPHFLFNSINTIYFQIDKTNTTARETLSAFSDMLRYQLYECIGREVPVEKEIAYVRNYVDLQRLRKDKNYSITFEGEPLRGFTIAPMLLIPFVENAFKHVSHNQEGNEIAIRIGRRGDMFSMSVFNTRDPGPAIGERHQGIGLQNVRRRLDLLYNGRHNLQIVETDRAFKVDLEIKIEA